MDALLFKTNHRGTLMMREENRKIKRDENLKRTKQARGVTVHDKRKIPKNLELSNESIHAPAPKVINKKPTRPVSNKPSRIELLREWRSKKINEKACTEKNRKAPFIVKHLVYKDSKRGNTAGKENIENSIEKIEKHMVKNQKRTLRERNENITYNVSKLPQVIKPVQKQSYSDWKKTQGQEPKKPVVAPTTRSTRSKLPEVKQNKCPPQNTRSRPTTRSMKNTANNSTQKTKTVSKKSVKETTKHTKGKKEEKETEKIPNENISVNEIIPDVNTEAQDQKHDLKSSIEENIAVPEKVNIFSVLSSNNSEDIVPVATEYTTEPLVNEKTEFLPPTFTNFKFDQKVILEALSDFVSPTSDPDEAELFTTNITAIENKGSEGEETETKDVKERKKSHEDAFQNMVKLETKTPVLAFKEREGLVRRKTPTSTPKRLSMSGGKRSSLTPNPMNFLHTIEDPVAVKSETPKAKRKSCSRVSKVLSVDTKVEEEEEEESESVKHFTQLVAAEEAKFSVNLDKWEKILEEKLAPEEHQGNILAAIGQAQLFMRKRFNQFKELIKLHKDKSAEKAAHASDLDGFWEMIFYQVEDVHKRFDDLNKLEGKQWVVDEPVKIAKKKVAQKPKQKKVVASKPKPSAAVSKKKSDFAKFRQQMMAKKKAEVEEQNVDADFVKILTPIQNGNKKTALTPLRCSVRNLPETPKEASNVCMVFPVTNLCHDETKEENSHQKDAPAPAIETVESPVMIDETKSIDDEETLKPLRRSTRKTPSKYSSMNFIDKKKPEDVACNLFEVDEKETVTEGNEMEFTKYLSKTIQPGHRVQRDLLTSFDTPQNVGDRKSKPSTTTEDLMMFASPIVQPVFTEPESVKTESNETSNVNSSDLLI